MCLMERPAHFFNGGRKLARYFFWPWKFLDVHIVTGWGFIKKPSNTLIQCLWQYQSVILDKVNHVRRP